MVQARRSPEKKSNSKLVQIKRKAGEDNLAWLERVTTTAPTLAPREDVSHILLFGGNDLQSFRFRLAQAHVRQDLSPSAWSQVVLVGSFNTKTIGNTPILSVGAIGGSWYADQKGFAPASNGIQGGKLKSFDSANVYPNIAVLAIPVAWATLEKYVVQLKDLRLSVDFSALLLRWLQYAWGVGQVANPLQEGYGFPDACMVDVACSMADLDISPGIESKICCPETIWQTARYWNTYVASGVRQGDAGITGCFIADHNLVPEN